MIYKLIGKAKGIFNNVTIMDMLMSVIFVIVGIVFLIASNINIVLVSIFTGILLILNAIIAIYSNIKNEEIALFSNNLIFGSILVIIGVAATFLNIYLNIILGLYLIAVGAHKINYGIILKGFNESSWLLTLVIGVLLIIIGLVTIFTKLDTILNVSGIYLIGYGIINFVSTLLIRKRSQYFL